MRLIPFAVLAALAPAAASAADFSGTWKIDNLFNGSSSTVTCTIVQAGAALTGSCKPEIPGIAASSLTGAVDGSSAKWGYDVVFNGNAGIRAYRETGLRLWHDYGSGQRSGRARAWA